MDDNKNPPPLPADESPPIIPGCDVIERMADYGDGRLFRVWHRLMGQERVVREVKVTAPSGSAEREHLLREWRARTQLCHHGIIKVFDAWMHGDIAYLAMEYFPGRTLGQWRADHPSVVEREAGRIGWQLADALALAHGAAISHQGLSPRNVLMDETFHVKTFGFALIRADRDDGADDGPPPSPGGRLAADLRGLGNILHFCLTGKISAPADPPAPAEGDPIAKAPPDAPLSLDDIIARLLSPRPDGHFAAFSAVRDALAPCLREEPSPPNASRPKFDDRRVLLTSTLPVGASLIQCLHEKTTSLLSIRSDKTDGPASPASRRTAGPPRDDSTATAVLRGRPSSAAPARPSGMTTTLFPRAAPSLRAYAPMHGWRECPVGDQPLTLGRLPDNGMVLPDSSVSRRHASAVLDDRRRLVIRDVGSSFGVLVHGRRTPEATLDHGASVQIGCFVLEYDNGAFPPDANLASWIGYGVLPLPADMRLAWNAATEAGPQPPAADAYPGGVMAFVRDEPSPGAAGKVVLTWPDGARFVLPAVARETVPTRLGRLTVFRLYRPTR